MTPRFRFDGCLISELRTGIELSSWSNNNTVTGNRCNNNNYCDIQLYHSSNNTVTGNTCSDRDVYESSGSNIGLYQSSDNTITGNTCRNASDGISLAPLSHNNTITGNTCSGSSVGIGISGKSHNNTIAGNRCNNNVDGIRISESNNNTITGNTYNDNSNGGITLDGSSNNTVTGNTCIRGTGLASDYTEYGHTIKLMGNDSTYNLIADNNIMGKNYINSGTGNTFVNNKYN